MLNDVWKTCFLLSQWRLLLLSSQEDQISLIWELKVRAFSPVAQSCLTLCNPMDSSMSGLYVCRELQEPAQSHIPWVSDANHLILCHPLLLLPSIFPSISIFSNESVLRIRWPEYWSFSFSISLPMNIQDWFPLEMTGLISLQSKGLSRVFSNTTVQKHQFFGTQLSL